MIWLDALASRTLEANGAPAHARFLSMRPAQTDGAAADAVQHQVTDPCIRAGHFSPEAPPEVTVLQAFFTQ